MAKKGNFFKNTLQIVKNTWTIFSNANGLKFSASLAYYTVFSIAPLLMLVIALVTIFLGEKAIEGEIYQPMKELIGSESAKQLETMIGNLSLNTNNTISLVIGLVTLIIGATTVFGDMQHSINDLWAIRPKPKRGWVKMLKDRLLSGSLILSLGFLLIVSFVVSSVVVFLLEEFSGLLGFKTMYIAVGVDYLVNLLVIAILFGIIFKFLPDVRIRWREVRSGALFTALLFMIGRFLISFYISTTVKTSTYGAAGSIVVILLWVYYSAAILYLGAAFTRAYAEWRGVRIFPAEFAVIVEHKELERTGEAVPKACPDPEDEAGQNPGDEDCTT